MSRRTIRNSIQTTKHKPKIKNQATLRFKGFKMSIDCEEFEVCGLNESQMQDILFRLSEIKIASDKIQATMGQIQTHSKAEVRKD